MPYLNTNEISTYCEVHGRGTPLIFLHGAMVDHRMWHPQISEFAGKYQVIAYDLRGHGKTGPSSASYYTTGLMAEDLLDLMLALNLNHSVLCGLSLGGMIAQQFAVTHPEMISGLILCDTAASMTLTLPDKIQTYLFGWSIAPSVRMIGSQRFTDYAFWLAKVMHGEHWFGCDAQTREYIRQCMNSLETREMAKIYQMILRFRAVDLRSVRVPTLLIYGKHETKSISQHTAYLKKQLTYSQLEIVPNAGHTTNLENPEKFNAILQNFLMKLSQATLEQGKSQKA